MTEPDPPNSGPKAEPAKATVEVELTGTTQTVKSSPSPSAPVSVKVEAPKLDMPKPALAPIPEASLDPGDVSHEATTVALPTASNASTIKLAVVDGPVQPVAPPMPSGPFLGSTAPVMITGLGALLVLRGGQVVGDAGTGGALLLWLFALGLAACTGTALAAVASNARTDAPSVLGAIGDSLGRGVACTIGVPMWLARGFAAALAGLSIAACSEGLAPSAVLVAMVVVAVGTVVAWQVGPAVERATPFVLGAVVVGIASMVTGAGLVHAGPLVQSASYGRLLTYVVPLVGGLWVAPDPVGSTGEVRRSAPRWWGLGGALLLQVAVLTWLAQAGSPGTLMTDERVGLDAAAIPLVARLGLCVGAGFLAIASVVDGSRMLREVTQPAFPWFERTGAAEVATGGLALAVIAGLRGLDGAAIGLALSLLLAGTALCTVVAIELGLGLTSFRPPRGMPLTMPAIGAIGSALAMVAIHPVGAVVIGTASMAAATWLTRTPARTAREHSALLTAVAEWLNRRSSAGIATRAWKPSLLLPLGRAEDLWPSLDFLTDLVAPEGAMQLVGMGEGGGTRLSELERAAGLLRARSVHAGATWLTGDPATSVPIALEALRLAAFRPNLLALRLPPERDQDRFLATAVAAARRTEVGVLLVGTPADTPVVSGKRIVTLWVRAVPGAWDPLVGYEGRNLDLTLLLGYRLARRWGSQLRLVTVVTEPEHRPGAEQFLASLVSLARLPSDTTRLAIVGAFEQAVDDLSNSDLDVFGLQPEPDLELARRLIGKARSTCLFVLDSGRESALV